MPPTSDTTAVAERPSKVDIDSAPPVALNGETAEAMDLDEQPDTTANADNEKKRKSKHEGETPEERAERKRRKKEKKEKKEKKKSKGAAESDSD